jgi:branched-chain amino acid transport system ATP-binding protein
VALMIALGPQVLMFDEPTAGMSVDEVPVILDLIGELKADMTAPSCWWSTRWT